MKCSAIDLFCGGGGLTHGVQKSGIKVIAGIDIDSTCKFAYEKNNNALFINKSVIDFSSEELKALYPKNTKKILMGCAPCQPFSKYTKRYRKDGQQDEKWMLLYKFSELIETILPDVVSMENVPELAKENVFEDFVASLKEKKYYVSWNIVNCPDYGVPQNRKRLVLLASKLGEIKLIEPKYNSKNYITVREAISKLPKISDGEKHEKDSLHLSGKLTKVNKLRIKQSVPGGTWKDWDKSLLLECHKKKAGKSYGSVYGRMEWDKPSPTITTQFYGFGNGRFGHPEQDRALSLREGAILQSFPPDYKFADENNIISKKDIGKHIGNAVPVELGRAIGESILKHFKEKGK